MCIGVAYIAIQVGDADLSTQRASIRSKETHRVSLAPRVNLGRGALYILLVVLAIATVGPFLYAFFASFKSLDELLGAGATLLPREWVFDNYRNAWIEGGFSQYLLNSVLVSAMVVVYDTMAATACGYALARMAFRGKRLLEILMATTIFIGVGTATLFPRFLIAQSLGLANLVGIALVQLSGMMVIHTFLIKTFSQSIDVDVEEASRIDGCGPLRTYAYIVFPLLRPIVATTIILAFQASWNSFQIPLVFTLARPDLRTLPVGVYALQSAAGEAIGSYDLMMAGAMITLIPVIGLFVLLQRYYIKGLTEGALSG